MRRSPTDDFTITIQLPSDAVAKLHWLKRAGEKQYKAAMSISKAIEMCINTVSDMLKDSQKEEMIAQNSPKPAKVEKKDE